MDEITRRTKEAFEPKPGRTMTDEEAAEFAMHMRRFAAFLIDCSKDDALMVRLGLRKAEPPSARPRVADNTTLAGRNAVREPLLAETVPPTGASSRDTFPHRDSSASIVSTTPAGQPAATQAIQPVTTGATVDGSL